MTTLYFIIIMTQQPIQKLEVYKNEYQKKESQCLQQNEYNSCEKKIQICHSIIESVGPNAHLSDQFKNDDKQQTTNQISDVFQRVELNNVQQPLSNEIKTKNEQILQSPLQKFETKIVVHQQTVKLKSLNLEQTGLIKQIKQRKQQQTKNCSQLIKQVKICNDLQLNQTFHQINAELPIKDTVIFSQKVEQTVLKILVKQASNQHQSLCQKAQSIMLLKQTEKTQQQQNALNIVKFPRQIKLQLTRSFSINHGLLEQGKKDIKQQAVLDKTEGDKQPLLQQLKKEDQDTPKQSLKVENLYISSLLSSKGSGIKPPESTGQKKAKIWQKKFSLKSPIPTPTPVQTTNIEPIVPCLAKIQLASNIQQADQISDNAKNQTRKVEQEQSNLSVNTQKCIQKKQSVIIYNKSDQLLNFNDNNEKNTVIQEQIKKIEGENLSLKDKDQSQIQFHQSKHHPLENYKPITELQKVNIDQYDQQPQSTLIDPLPEIKTELQNQLPRQLQGEISQNFKNIIEQDSQSHDSHSSKESISEKVEHIHHQMNKIQLEVESLNKEKIKEMQEQLKRQIQINKELHNQSSLPTKLLISSFAGAVAVGVTWLARKSKQRSIIFGVATSIAAFIITN